MKKMILAILFATVLTSCDSDVNDVQTTKTSIVNAHNKSMARGEAGSYDPGDLRGVKVLNTTDFPLSTEQNDLLRLSPVGGCKITDYFVGVSTGNYYYHGDCNGTHYIVVYYSFSQAWGPVWAETPYDHTIWHGGK